MGLFRLGRVTTAMIIICVAAFIIQQFVSLQSLYFSREFISKPWILVTSLFLHANWLHLLYNMYALFIFGNVLEINTSSKFAFIMMMAGGIFGNLMFAIVSPDMALGFSGAIYALIAGVTIIKPNVQIPLPLGFIAVPAKAWIAGPIMALGELVMSFISFDNIAHSAHIGGFVLGIVLAYYYRKKILKPQSKPEDELPQIHI